MRKLRITNFELVDTYIFAIESCLQRMQVCKGFDDSEYKNRLEEQFFDGIPEDIKARLALNDEFEYDTILARIKKSEAHITRSVNTSRQSNYIQFQTKTVSTSKQIQNNTNNHYNSNNNKINMKKDAKYMDQGIPINNAKCNKIYPIINK